VRELVAVVVLVRDPVTRKTSACRIYPPTLATPFAMAEHDGKQEGLESLRDMKLKEEDYSGDVDMDTMRNTDLVKRERSGSASADASLTGTGTPSQAPLHSRSPVKSQSTAPSPIVKPEQEDTVGGGVTLKLEPGKPPKLTRATSHKVERRPPPLFSDYEDKSGEATSTFSVIPQCIYARKGLGDTEHALECDCAEEWGKSPRITGQQTA